MGHLRYSIKVGFAHLFLCLFLASSLCSAQNNQYNQPGIIDAYNDILKLKIEKGRQALSKINPDRKSLGHYYYVKSLADIIELLLDENEARYKKYDDLEDDYLKEIKEMDDDDPFKLFYTSEIKLQWSLVKIQYGDELKAGIGLRSAWNSIQKNHDDFPNFNANNKTLGLLHVLFGSIPDGYQWILKLLGIKGNIQTGLDHLAKISTSSPFWLETQIVRSVVSVNILNNSKESIAKIETLLSDNKDNLLLIYLYNTTLLKNSRSEEALNNLSKLLLLGDEYLFLSLIYYQIGEAYLHQQDFANAELFYSKFLNNYRGVNFVKDAWFKTALTYWLRDNQKSAEVNFEKADDTGKVFVSADKNADGILDEDNYPNKDLMKIRLATDGGYYDEAESILSNLNESMFESKKEKTIYYYRQARLKHKKNETEGAIYFYLFSIKKAGNENWYYAPNACLNTGYIYMERNNVEKARYYFNKALEYKKHKYKSEIDVKARTALQFLGKVESKKKKK
jgi:Tfp pilus assembly protein PilF